MISVLAKTMPSIIPGYGGVAITAFQIFATAMSYTNEMNGDTRTQYSKFVTQNSDGVRMVPSRVGMTIIYAPALCVAGLVCAFSRGGTFAFLPDKSPAAVLLFLHFLKRVLEVQFMHRYSGSAPLSVSSLIGVCYSLNVLLISSVAELNPSNRLSIIGTGEGIDTRVYRLFTILNS